MGRFIYREENLQHLDLVLDEARKVGIRIICALCNNWQEFGYVFLLASMLVSIHSPTVVSATS